MKKTISSMLEGVKIGSFVYLLVLLVGIQKPAPTASNIISVLIMSALIGAVSLIFDWDRLPSLVLLLIHALVIAGLASSMMAYNGWGSLLQKPVFWIDFVLIYLFIALLIRLQIYLTTRKINTALNKRRKKQMKK